MRLNEEQQTYIAWAAEELVRQLHEFTSTHDDLEPHPKDYRFFIEPNPDPALFDDERYCISIHLYRNQFATSKIFMQIVVVSFDKWVQVTRGLAYGDYADIQKAVEGPDLAQKIATLIPEFIDKLEDI